MVQGLYFNPLGRRLQCNFACEGFLFLFFLNKYKAKMNEKQRKVRAQTKEIYIAQTKPK